MNLKIMIADDEQRSVQYIEELINWEAYGFELVPSAYNGREALALYKRYRPDIVITDISMPFMNGIELAQSIKRITDSCHIIFLTAFDEFTYAKDAVKIGAADYILKHELSHTYLLDKLLKLQTEFYNLWMRTRTQFEYELTQLFHNGADAFSLEGMSFKLRKLFDQKYFAAVIEGASAIPCFESEIQQTSVNGGINYQELRAIVSGMQDKSCYLNIARIGTDRYLLLYDVSDERPFELNYHDFMFKIKELDKKLRLNTTMHFCVFCFAEKDTPQMLFVKYLEQKRKFCCKFFEPHRRIFCFREILCGTCTDEYKLDSYKKCVENYLPEEAEGELEKIFRPAFGKQDGEYLNRAMSGVLQYLKEGYKNLWNIQSGNNMELLQAENRQSWYSYEQAIAWIKDATRRLIETNAENMKARYTSSVLQTMRYLRKNFQNAHLDVNMVADHIHASKSWISVQFKKETGKTIIEYLTGYRIYMAKQYIREGYKIFQIAEMTGFSSNQYFCKVFKQVEGISPGTYKNTEHRDEMNDEKL